MAKGKAKPYVWVPKKYIEPTFESCSDGSYSDTGLDSSYSFDESLSAERRPSLVQFRLDLNLTHPPGPVSTPKGGFNNKELLQKSPAQGILKCM